MQVCDYIDSFVPVIYLFILQHLFYDATETAAVFLSGQEGAVFPFSTPTPHAAFTDTTLGSRALKSRSLSNNTMTL